MIPDLTAVSLGAMTKRQTICNNSPLSTAGSFGSV
jgi:poly(hydroxyalkanoate) depolymerase family esterase